MKRATETRAKPRSLAVLVVTLAVLSGCEEALSPEQASSDATDDTVQANEPIELFPDYNSGSGETVEAPENFSVVEAGLWDGRPSLGGIWVAHPDVTKPERVKIVNTTNNKSITGALFRRERNLPGPALQLSSAAAEKLGILPGAPTKVEVVALRRKPVEEKQPEPEAAQPVETAEDKPADAEQPNEVDTASADTEQPAKRKWWQKKEPAAVAGAAGVAAATTTDTATDAVEDVVETAAQSTPTANLSDPEVTPPEEKPAKRKWWQKKEPIAEAETTGAATAVASTAVAATDAADETVETAAQTTPSANLSEPELTAPAEEPAKRKWWQKKDPEEITETPLDPIAGAAAAIEAAEPTPVSAPAAAPENTAPRSLTKPFVQVGTFTVEANAKSAVSKIERNGLSASIYEVKTGDTTVWRVLVGPAKTRAERNAIQSDVKDLGFTDAFNVKN